MLLRWGALSVVAADVGHQQAVLRPEIQPLGMKHQLEGVFVVVLVVDELAHVVEDGGGLE